MHRSLYQYKKLLYQYLNCYIDTRHRYIKAYITVAMHDIVISLHRSLYRCTKPSCHYIGHCLDVRNRHIIKLVTVSMYEIVISLNWSLYRCTKSLYHYICHCIDARIIVDQYKTLLYEQRNNVTRHSLNVMNHCIKVNRNHSINVRRYCKGME